MSLDTQIDGIGPSTAKRLRQQGIETVEELAAAHPDDITVPTGNASTLIQRANQQIITSKSASDLLDEYEQTTYLSTGVDGLDDVMDGGWEAGTVGMLYGKSGKGKTQVALSSLVTGAAEGTVAYVQTEMQSKAVAERLHNLAEDPDDLDNIQFYEAYSIEDQFSTYQKVEDDIENPVAIVIDSFTAQFRMTDEFDDRSSLSARSRVLGKHLRKLGGMARSYDIPIILTGQVYPAPEAYGKGDNLWGGEKMKHFISYFIRMSTGQGELVQAELENHPGRSEDEVLINITNTDLESMDN